MFCNQGTSGLLTQQSIKVLLCPVTWKILPLRWMSSLRWLSSLSRDAVSTGAVHLPERLRARCAFGGHYVC